MAGFNTIRLIIW